MLTTIAALLTSNGFIWLYVILIFFIFAFTLIRFYQKASPVRRDLEAAVESVETPSGMTEFAAAYPEIDERLKQTSLKHCWHEFTETLLFPHIDLEDEEVIHNTQQAGNFFSRESTVSSRLNLRFYNAFPNILTALGIMGTFLGLVAGIYLAKDGLAADDIDEAKTALSHLLRGASLAFLTSLAGLSASMVASWREKATLHELDALIGRFVVALDKRVKRLPTEKIEARIYRENRKQTAALESFSNDLAVKIAEVLDDKVSQPMGESMDRLLASLDRLGDQQANAQDELLKSLMSEFSQSISGAAGDEMKAFASTLNQLNEVFGAQIENTKEAQQSAAQQMQEASAAMQESLAGIAQITGDAKALMQETAQLITLARDGQQKLSETIQPISGLVDALTEARAETVDAVGIIKDCSGDLAAAVENLAEIQDQVSQSWQAYEGRFENVDQSLSQVFERLQEGLSAYSEQVAKHMQDLESQSATVVTHLAGAIREMNNSIDELSDVLHERPQTRV